MKHLKHAIESVKKHLAILEGHVNELSDGATQPSDHPSDEVSPEYDTASETGKVEPSALQDKSMPFNDEEVSETAEEKKAELDMMKRQPKAKRAMFS